MTDEPDEEAPDFGAPQPESFETARPVRAQPTPRAPLDNEQYLLGCFLIDGGQTLDKAIQAGLASTDFAHHHNAATYAALRRLRSTNTPIALDTLVEHLGDRLPEAGGINTLLALDHQTTTARADHALTQILDASERRRIERLTAEIQERTAAGESIADLHGLITRLSRTPPKLGSRPLSSRRVRATNPPPEPATRLFLAGKPICTPGNITTLISRAKTGKTATLGAATAAVITTAAGTSALKPDNLGFTAANPDGHAVIVIDTEQSPFDAYTCYKRSLDRAGQTEDPKWLYHYTLVGLGPDDLKRHLDEAVATATQECKAVFLLVLDGVADFVNSVNDEAECNGFVNWLRERTVTHDCPAICVIHSNEGVKTGDDGRGHLGKQLTRKAESNLLLKKAGDITTITSEKQRKAPITEDDGIAFRWSDEHGRHISCDSTPPEKKAGGRKRAHNINEFWDCIPKRDAKPLPGAQIHRMAATVADVKLNTFKDLLAAAAKDGELIRTFDEKQGYLYQRSV